MNVVTALNKNYIKYAVVMLTSLCINNTSEEVVCYLLHHELDDENFHQMNEALNKYNITLVSLYVNPDLFSERMRVTDMWTKEAYYRLMLPEILPVDVDRVLYFDVDLIINRDISELYNSDFGEAEIIATEDAGGRVVWEEYDEVRQNMFSPMIEKGFRYINSGVMLLNMTRIREDYSFDSYLRAMEEWGYQMVAPDQDIINYVHWNRITYVDSDTFDLMVGYAHAKGMTYEEAKDKVAILHFTGPKPWHNKNFHFPIQQIWWDYAKETPYYHDLMEEFVRSAMFDPTVENIMTEYANGSSEADELRKKLSESIELNQKLMSIVEGTLTK